jgi:DNA-binding Lrp family transcriptional regulator
MPRSKDADFVVDELNLKILESLAKNAELPFKELAENLDVDQRTVARRIARIREDKLIRTTLEIDWPKIGVHANAFVGTSMALGPKSAAQLVDFIRTDPRIVEAYSTIGTHQYFLKILESDLQRLRDEVLRDLEPITADLSASVISSEMKQKDFSPFLRFIRETRFPRSRSND